MKYILIAQLMQGIRTGTPEWEREALINLAHVVRVIPRGEDVGGCLIVMTDKNLNIHTRLPLEEVRRLIERA